MICSQCNVVELVPILYGYPTQYQIELAQQDKIALGGFPVKEYTHYCYACNDTFII